MSKDELLEFLVSEGTTQEEAVRIIEDLGYEWRGGAIDDAEDDTDEGLLIAARVEGEQILHHIRKALSKDADLLQGGEGPLLTDLSNQLEAALQESDRQRILQLGQKVDEESAAFAQRRIERDLELAIGGKATDAVADALGLS